jgi:hypothetical protein
LTSSQLISKASPVAPPPLGEGRKPVLVQWVKTY